MIRGGSRWSWHVSFGARPIALASMRATGHEKKNMKRRFLSPLLLRHTNNSPPQATRMSSFLALSPYEREVPVPSHFIQGSGFPIVRVVPCTVTLKVKGRGVDERYRKGTAGTWDLTKLKGVRTMGKVGLCARIPTYMT